MELKEDDIIENFVLIKLKNKYNKKQKWTSCIKDTNIIFDITICDNEITETLPMINQIISFGNEQFIIKESLGEGTYGTVNVLKELNSEKKYAIKFFRDSSEAIYEYKLYIQLFECPYIPHIYFKTNYCIVMDKFDENIYKKEFELNEIIRISKNILSAIAFIHDKKLVHGDIKPENILIDSNKTAYLCDFTNCYPINHKIKEISTIFFRAPENCDPSNQTSNGYIIDTPTDIWSFGITLLSMFNKGKTPKFFSILDEKELFDRISSQYEIDEEIDSILNNYVFYKCHENLIDFSKLLLTVDPKNRINAKTALVLLNNIKVNE